MKKLLVAVILAGVAWYYTKPPTVLDHLMKASETVTPDAGRPHIVRSGGGADFSVDAPAEPGAPTIVEFYTDSCTGCQRLHQHYKRFLAVRPDVVVRQVHMPDNWNVDWARQRFHQEIGSTPHILIYGADGQLLAGDVGLQKAGFDLLYEWLNAELKKEFERQHRG